MLGDADDVTLAEREGDKELLLVTDMVSMVGVLLGVREEEPVLEGV